MLATYVPISTLCVQRLTLQERVLYLTGVILLSEDLHRVAYNAAFEHFDVRCGGELVFWSEEFYDQLQNTVGGGKPKMRWYFGAPVCRSPSTLRLLLLRREQQLGLLETCAARHGSHAGHVLCSNCLIGVCTASSLSQIFLWQVKMGGRRRRWCRVYRRRSRTRPRWWMCCRSGRRITTRSSLVRAQPAVAHVCRTNRKLLIDLCMLQPQQVFIVHRAIGACLSGYPACCHLTREQQGKQVVSSVEHGALVWGAASGEVPAREGVLRIMDETQAAGLKLGVCSAATKSSAVCVLDSLLGKERFQARL